MSISLINNGGSDGAPENGSRMQSVTSPQTNAALPAIRIDIIEGVRFIIDSSGQYLAKKDRYSLKPHKNPSGKLVVELNGYRPPGALIEKKLAVGADEEDKKPSSGRVRENYNTAKEGDAARTALILADADSESRYHSVLTFLPDADVRDAEKAMQLMSSLPPPDWTVGRWSFEKIVKYVCDKYRACRNPKLLSEAVEQFVKLEEAANLKFATIEGKKSHLRRLIKACNPGICVHEVPLAVLKGLIHSGQKRKTWKKNKSNLNTFFSWAAHQDQGYIADNPVSGIDLKKQKDDYTVPKILTNQEVVELLTKAQTFKNGRLFLFCLVAIVVALRPAELARITALQKVLGIGSFHFGDEPDEQFITVIGKTRAMRDSIIPAEFVALIKTYVEAGYPVIPRYFAQDWTLLRAEVGFLGRADLLPAHLLSADLIPWTADVLRHIGITHHLNWSQDEHKTALWAGDSPRMIFFHYRGKATRRQTREFYAIAKKLKLPTLAELKAEGVPEPALDSELKRLKCPVDRPNTFRMDKEQFAFARKCYLKRCPEAAIPEKKGGRREGHQTKRRMLGLPTKQDEQLKLIWTNKLSALAIKYKVTRGTISNAIADMKLPSHLLPPKGFWQKRAAGQNVLLPDEVAAVFPHGLPKYSAPVGCQIKLQFPTPPKFLRLVWLLHPVDNAIKLGCSASSVERHIRRHRVPRPPAGYWKLTPEQRQLPDRIKHLLTLDATQLAAELAKEHDLSADDKAVEHSPSKL